MITQIKSILLSTSLTISASFSAFSQSVNLGFDNNRSSDFGAFETTGSNTALIIAGAGSNFSAMDGSTTASFNISGAPLTRSFDFTATSSVMGSLNIDGTGLDIGGSGIDSGETLTFVFNVDILITEFDFSTLQDTQTAFVSVAGSGTSYNGTSNNDAPIVNLPLAAGQPLVFSYGGVSPTRYDLQAFSFNIVPEFSTYGLTLGLLALVFVMIRHR